MRRSISVVDAGLLVLVFLAPLAWAKSVMTVFTLPKFLALNAGLCLAAWGAALRPESLAAGETALDLPLLAGLGVAVLSAAASSDPSTSLIGRYDSYAFGLWGLAIAAAAVQLAARSARGREAERARWLIWSAALAGGYGVLQKCGFDPIFHIKSLPAGGRAVSTLGSPVDLGAFLAVAWPLSLWGVDIERRPLPAAAAILIAGGILASGSRAAALAAGVGAAAYWLMSRRRPRESLLPSLGIALAAVAGAIAWSFRPHASVSDVSRLEVWKTSWTALVRNPWLGVGPDGFEDFFRRFRTEHFVAVMGSQHHQAYPHNDLLQALACLGLLGAAAYAWLLTALARSARRSLEAETSRPLAAALAAGILALWVNLEFNPVAVEVVVFGALVAGFLTSLSSVPAETRRLPRSLFLAAGGLTTFGLACALNMARADAAYMIATRAQGSGDFTAARANFARARELLPCEQTYTLEEVNALGDWINATHDVPGRLALLALADADGRAALACHPRQINAHYIAGSAARMHVDLGFKDQIVIAAREFDAALEFDPQFGPLLAARLQVARMMGDAKLAAELESRLAPTARSQSR